VPLNAWTGVRSAFTEETPSTVIQTSPPYGHVGSMSRPNPLAVSPGEQILFKKAERFFIQVTQDENVPSGARPLYGPQEIIHMPVQLPCYFRAVPRADCTSDLGWEMASVNPKDVIGLSIFEDSDRSRWLGDVYRAKELWFDVADRRVVEKGHLESRPAGIQLIDGEDFKARADILPQIECGFVRHFRQGDQVQSVGFHHIAQYTTDALAFGGIFGW
jgi:hypothetical protein